MVKRIAMQDNSIPMHFDEQTYLLDVIRMLRQGETPDSHTRSEWERYKPGLKVCRVIRTKLNSFVGVTDKHSMLIKVLDSIFEALPTMPDELELEQLAWLVSELDEGREDLLKY